MSAKDNMLLKYLPRRFDSLPDTEVNHHPDGHQTQHELPVELSGLVQTRGDVQHLVPAQRPHNVYTKPTSLSLIVTFDHDIKQNSLPELNDGRPCVGQVSTRHVATDGHVSQAGVFAVLVVEGLDAAGRVPHVVTGGPGEGGVKGLNQVVEAPGQHHDVIGITKKHDDHGGITQT